MPFNPAVTDRSGEIMAQGISSIGSTISDAISQLGAQHRRLKALQGSAVDIFGMDKDEVSKMTVDDLEQHMRDQVLKSSLDTQEAQRQALLDKGNVNWDEVMPHEFTTSSGVKGVYGKGGQFQFDPTQFMNDGPPPDGYSVVPTPHGPQYLRTPAKKTLPTSYDARLSNSAGNGIADQLAEAQTFADKSDDDLLALGSIKGDQAKLASRRAANAKQIENLQKALKNHLDSYQSRYPDAMDWNGEYQRYNLPMPAASSSTPAASSSAGAKGAPAAASDQRVQVKDKDGNIFTVPTAQLEAAIAQGYTQVK